MKKMVFLICCILAASAQGQITLIDNLAPKNAAFNVLVDFGYLGDSGTDAAVIWGEGLALSTATISIDTSEMIGNVAWGDDSTDASLTWTFALSGANDPVWTIGANSFDLTTGALKQGGTQVLLVGDAATTHALLDGSVHSDSVADAVTRGSLVYGNSTPKWDELTIGAADTFLGSDGTDASYRTAAQVMASLSGEAAAGFSFNSQNLTSVGTIGSGAITATGNILANANLSVGNTTTTAGVLTLLEDDDDGANFASFMVPALAANTVYTLPPDDGDAGEVLRTDGAGVLTWVGAAAPGAHDHDTDTLELDGVTSDGGAFAFTTSAAVTFNQSLILSGTTAIGLDMSGGTFATAVQNWPAGPVIQVAGTQTIKFDDTNYNILFGTDAFGGLPGGITQAQNEGSYNIGFGYEAGYNNDTNPGANAGLRNVFIGYRAGRGSAATTGGFENVAIGKSTLEDIEAANQNVAIGYNAGMNITAGDRNVCIGSLSGSSITTAVDNFFLGANAGKSNISGAGNVAIGTNAFDVGTAYGNVIIGTSAGGSLTTGFQNLYFGQSAGIRNQSGDNNVAIGAHSLRGVTSNSNDNNVALGAYTGYGITTGDGNVFIGFQSGYNQTTNSNLIIIDNRNQGSAAAEITDSLIYGVFSAAPASQTLSINAATTVRQDLTVKSSAFIDGELWVAGDKIAGGLTLRGDSTTELNVKTYFTSRVQQGGANKFTVSVKGEYSGGGDLNYVIEIDEVTNPEVHTSIGNRPARVATMTDCDHASGPQTITVSGDQRAAFSDNDTFSISGSASNDNSGYKIDDATITYDDLAEKTTFDLDAGETALVASDETGTVTIDAYNNTFRWSDDGGGTWDESGVETQSGYPWYALNNAVEINFLSNASDILVVGDQWTFTAEANPTVAFNVDTRNGVTTIDAVVLETSRTPTSTADTGTTGAIAWDGDYIYVCTATNHWERAAIGVWGQEQVIYAGEDVIYAGESVVYP